MTRIPYPSQEEIERKVWKGANSAGKMCAHMPDDVLGGWRSIAAAVLNNDTLDPALREMAIVRIGHLSNSAYEIHHHANFARKIGVAENKLEALQGIGTGSDAFTALERAVVTFTDELVLHVRPSDEALADLRAHMSTPEIFTLIVSIGLYMTVARVLETTGIEIEPNATFDPSAVARG